MKSNIIASILSAVLLSYSCSMAPENSSDPFEMKIMDRPIETSIPSDSENTTSTATQYLKIIKWADCRFKVKDVDSATAITKDIIRRKNGYIAKMHLENDARVLENKLTLRVPAQHFDAVLQELSSIAEFIDYSSISATDVSEEFTDLQARLQTKRAVMQRYDQILRTRAKTVEEVLLTEDKLRVIQEEIEVAQGRLQFLEHKVTLSTIELDLYQTVTHQEKPESYSRSIGSKISERLLFGWDLIVGLFLSLLYIWPILVLGTGLALYLKYRKG